MSLNVIRSCQRKSEKCVILNTKSKHIDRGIFYDAFCPWLGKGIFTSTASKWQNRRKMLSSTFGPLILKQFNEIFIKEGENITNSLKKTEGSVTKDLIPFISEHMLNAICETAMGTSLQEMDPMYQQYQQAVSRMTQICMYRTLRLWLHNDWIFSLTSKGREQKRLLKILHEFSNKIIAQRKVYHKDKEQYFRNLNKDEVAVDAETISTYYNHRHIEWTADGNDGSRKIDRVKSNQLQ